MRWTACGQAVRKGGGLILAALWLAGCGAEGGDNGTVPGLGTSGERPTGTVYTFPEGTALVSAVGADHVNGKINPVCPPDNRVVTGNQATGDVDLCVTFRNNNAQATAVTLPTGLLFLAKNSPDPRVAKSQNGLLGQTVTISLPAGAETTFILRLYCSNRSAPSSDRPGGVNDPWQENWEYETTLIATDYAPLREVARVIDTKSIAYQYASTMQDAVWDITETRDGTGRSTDQRLADAFAKLDTVPNR